MNIIDEQSPLKKQSFLEYFYLIIPYLRKSSTENAIRSVFVVSCIANAYNWIMLAHGNGKAKRFIKIL